MTLYADLIRNALNSVNESDFLTAGEKQKLREDRLVAIVRLSITAREALQEVSTKDLERGTDMLNSTQQVLQKLVN